MSVQFGPCTFNKSASGGTVFVQRGDKLVEVRKAETQTPPQTPLEKYEAAMGRSSGRASLSAFVTIAKWGDPRQHARHDFEDALEEHVESCRKSGETYAQALCRVFQAHDETAIALYKASRIAKFVPRQPVVQEHPMAKALPAEEKAEQLAEGIAKARNITMAKARCVVWQENKELYEQYRAQHHERQRQYSR